MLRELLTNSLRHAFPNGRLGTIELKLERKDTLLRAVAAVDER
jgi:two-component sensor histidine kinase